MNLFTFRSSTHAKGIKTTRRAARWVVLAISLLLGAVVGVGPAQAGTFSGMGSGSDSYVGSGSTTLTYPNGHAAIYETVWAAAGSFGSRPTWPYSIKFYNASGQLVWNATNQTQRNYYIGGNVTRIVITPNGGYQGVYVEWDR